MQLKNALLNIYIFFKKCIGPDIFRQKISLSKYVSTRETTNFAHLAMIIFGPCTDVLRKEIQPADLSHKVELCISNYPKNKKPPINKQQEQLVYSRDYSNFDITLLYMLLRNVSGIPSHSTKWGNKPSPGDISVSANIERIREIRNRYYGLATNCSLSDFDFKQICTTIHQIVKKLQDYLGTSTIHQNELSNLRCCSLENHASKDYWQLTNCRRLFVISKLRKMFYKVCKMRVMNISEHRIPIF